MWGDIGEAEAPQNIQKVPRNKFQENIQSSKKTFTKFQENIH